MDWMTIGLASAIALAYVFGIFIVRMGILEVRYGIGARTWPTTDARLEKCVLNVRRTGNHGSLYEVSVRYTYELNGARYAGDNLAIGYVASSDRQAHEMTWRKVMGMTKFVIRYHPGKPEISTILPAENSLVFGTLVFGMLWLVFVSGFALAVLGFSGAGDAIMRWFA